MRTLRLRALLACAAIILAAGCGDARDTQSTAAASVAAPPVAGAQKESATGSSADQAQAPPQSPAQRANSGETAKASDDALRPMTKDEEANSMPRPSQANDHSTLSPPKDEPR